MGQKEPSRHAAREIQYSEGPHRPKRDCRQIVTYGGADLIAFSPSIWFALNGRKFWRVKHRQVHLMTVIVSSAAVRRSTDAVCFFVATFDVLFAMSAEMSARPARLFIDRLIQLAEVHLGPPVNPCSTLVKTSKC
jgi:hypothetical protein